MKSQEQLKTEGNWDVIRNIKIPGLGCSSDRVAVEDAIRGLPGVRRVSVDVDRHILVVNYDASQLNFLVITDALTGMNYPPLDTWWTRIKSSFYQYSDSNARDNAKAPPPACCNKSPK